MNYNFNIKNVDKELLAMLAATGLRSGSISVMWISIPFLMLQENFPLALIGVLETIGILASFVLKIPSRFYVERNGREMGTVLGLISLGVSFIILYLSRGFALVGLSVFLVSSSAALLNASLRTKIDEKYPKKGTTSKPTPFSLVSIAGSFVGLILAGIYNGTGILPIYAILSIVLLMAGILSSPILFVKKIVRPYRRTTRLSIELLRRPFEALAVLNRINKKEFLMAVSVTQLVIALSLGSVTVFFPALAIVDGLQRKEIFLLFAIVGIISFSITYVGKFFISNVLNRWFFTFKPFFLILPLILLSVTKSPEIFIVGYSLTVIWAFVEPGYSTYISNKFRPEERVNVNGLMILFTSPIMIISPLLGSLLWEISPQLLFAFAILPASVALLITTLSIGSLRVSSPQA